MVGLALVGIFAKMMREIHPLKQAVHLDHPSNFCPNVGSDYRCGILRMIHGREVITQIVNQCGNDPLKVHAVIFGSACGLEAMAEAINFVAV